MVSQHELMTTIVPSIGVVVGTLMFLSPLKAVLDMRRNGRLGELNPIPFPVVVANCVAWVGYSIVTKDPYVFMANDPGLVLGLFYTFSAYGFADSKMRNKMMALILIFTMALSGVSLTVASSPMSRNEKTLLWGITANVVLLIYYCAPLTTVKEVLMTRSSASLYWPLCLMNVLNGALWVGYGRNAWHGLGNVSDLLGLVALLLFRPLTTASSGFPMLLELAWVCFSLGCVSSSSGKHAHQRNSLPDDIDTLKQQHCGVDPEEVGRREPLLGQDERIRADMLHQRRGSSAADEV